MSLHRLYIMLMLAAAMPAWSQVSYNPSGQSRSTQRGNSGDVSVSRGPTNRRPANYDQYYYGRRNYAITPMIIPSATTARAPIILGPVRPYTDEEYARLVLSTLSAGSVAPPGQRTSTRSIVVAEDEAGANRNYKRAETRVVDVIDRGVLIVDTREEIRLRGVRMLSEKDPNEVDRYYAREAMRTIRDLTHDQPVFVEFEEPLRDTDGTVMATVFLSDGTELNRLLLERGLGQLEPRDFADDREISPLMAAEESARTSKIGLFSRFNQ